MDQGSAADPPGREAAAIKWLRLAHVEGADGLDERYRGPEPALAGKTVEEALTTLAAELQQTNTSSTSLAAVETVFENGFDPLGGGFRGSGKPYEVFDQWVEVLPTDQVVAVDYKPDTGRTP